MEKHWYDPVVQAEKKVVNLAVKDVDATMEHLSHMERKLVDVTKRHPWMAISWEAVLLGGLFLGLIIAQYKFLAAG